MQNSLGLGKRVFQPSSGEGSLGQPGVLTLELGLEIS